MVKISKNAKKILALTLAGVMTVGTVVPGSALSTVENVQAAEVTADDVVAKINEAVKEGPYYAVNTNYKGSYLQTIIDSVITNSGYDGKIEVKSGKITPTMEVSFTKTGATTEEIKNINIGERCVTATSVLSAWGEETFGSMVVNVNDMTPEAVKQALTKEMLERESNFNESINTFAADHYALSNLNIEVSSTADAAWNSDTLKVNYEEGATKGSFTLYSSLNGDKGYDTFDFSVNDVDTTDEKAAKALKEGYTAISSTKEHPYTQDDLKEGEATDKLDEVIVAGAVEYLKSLNYNYTTEDITVDQGTVSSYYDGVWKGTLSVKDAKVTLTVSVADPGDVKVDHVTVVGSIPEIEGTTTAFDQISGMDKVIFTITKSDGTVETQNLQYIIEHINDSDSYFTIDRSAYKQELGKYNIVLTVKDTKQKINIPVTVKATKDSITLEELGVITAGSTTTIKTITSSDSENLKVSVNNDKTSATVVAYKAGTYTLTTTSNQGNISTATVTVKANGEIKISADQMQGTITLPNTVENLGFVVRDEKYLTSDNEDVTVELATENGKSVIKVTALDEIKTPATIKLQGGKNGKLETSFKLTSDENGVITILGFGRTSYNLNSLAASDEVISKLSSTTYNSNDNVIEKAGLQEKDLMTVTLTDGTTDLIPVTDCKLEVKYHKKGEDSQYQQYIHISYGNKFFTEVALDIDTNTGLGTYTTDNTVENLGLLGTSVSVSKVSDTDIIACDAKIDGDKIVVTKKSVTIPTEGTENKVTVKDSLGNESVITVKIQGNSVTVTDFAPFKIQQVVEIVAPTKNSYKVGETLDVTGGKVTYVTEDGTQKTVNMIPAMYPDFDSAEIKADKVEVGFKYGYGSKIITADPKDNDDIQVVIKPQTITVKNTDLGFEADDKISGFSYAGDVTNTAEIKGYGKNVVVSAKKVNTATSIIVTSVSGKVCTLNVKVDANGNITTDTFGYGKEVSINNNVATLGLEATAVNVIGSAVKAKINGTTIVISGVEPGTATVEAVNAVGNKATISVTVDNKGNVVVTNIEKYKDYTPGWSTDANGNWIWIEEDGSVKEQGWINDGKNDYYIEGGVAVVSNWKLIGDTYYYFNKWGACIKNGWATINGCFYFFDKDGKMAESQWIKTGNYYYYVNKWGAAYTNGWYKIDGNYYCFNKWGAMYTNTYIGKYYVNKWGAWDSRYDKK